MRHGLWIMAEPLPALVLALRNFISGKFRKSSGARRLAWVINQMTTHFREISFLRKMKNILKKTSRNTGPG
jgi:hypothetical protein